MISGDGSIISLIFIILHSFYNNLRIKSLPLNVIQFDFIIIDNWYCTNVLLRN